MKLLPSVLIATAHACGRIPGAKETQAVLDGAKYGRGHTHEWTTNTPRPQIVPESQMIGEDDEWYAINDGVMGGVSTGSASWYALNDGVMGGVSSGASVPNDDYLKYKGQLSLENNGGFSQIRHDVEPDQFVGATSVTLHIRASAPGRDFKFIASAATSDWNLNIWEKSLTVGTEWTEVTIPFNEMDLQIMGKIIPGKKLTGDMIKKIGFMIMDKNTAPFELHVKDIRPNKGAVKPKYPKPAAAPKDEKWYSLNDGVMGGVSTGSAKWYSVNDGVMGGISSGSAKWYSLNDGVMGGVSSGSVKDQNQYLVYKGQLSLENNGGFSQIRHDTSAFNSANGVRLTLKATEAGRDFKFIASASESDWNLNIWEKSVVVGTDEVTIDIPFDQMDLQIMGKILPDGEKLTGDMVKKIGFMIMDKNTSPFELHIINVEPIGHGDAHSTHSAAADHVAPADHAEVDYAQYTQHKWFSVNDDVMGGKSTGHFALDEDTSEFLFWGQLSFENRGGFASLRTPVVGNELHHADGLAAVITGDGRTYKITAHKKGSYGMWSTEFKTTANEKTSIYFPFDEMTYKGWGKDAVGGAFNIGDINEIGFMINDKQPDEFRLKIHHVKPYARDSTEKWDSQEYHPQHFDTDHDASTTNLANWYANNWYSRNDDVMGGVSHGSPARNKETHDLKFWGQLSLENNGGFSTIRTDVGDALDGACGLHVHVRGDGRTYQFTAYPGDMKGRYQMDVETVAGEDTSFHVKFDDLVYHFWGWQKPMKPLTVDNVKGIGFMIADKNTDPFELDIVSIQPDMNCDGKSHAPSHSHEKPTGTGMMDLDWYPLNDGVMGGVSTGSIKRIGNDLVYKGQLSLENNGGFSTVRANVHKHEGEAKTGVMIKVMGSAGRSFKLNLGKSTSDMNLHTWTYMMDVTNEWKTIKVPFEAFKHQIMGKAPAVIEPIAAGDIEKVSISISDKNTTPFELTIGAIELY